ncbi:hypothetical protein CDAR_27101 [Caerostris darwini]|uniref:C2H2-type domain-containing protein n=1 Tax=Caerostris darwini TaxID=1538125 RepID=A0AAV4TEZ4_9ARAC|nr:hypothetical protein CDAR_27101 [Caerostris darwini]
MFDRADHMNGKMYRTPRKALRYHLFRIHQVSMGRPVVDTPAPSVSPGHSQMRDADTSPAEEAPLVKSTLSFLDSASSEPQVTREGQTVSFKLPLVGAVQCPDCPDTFTGKAWFSIKGSIIKHLRFKHHISCSPLIYPTFLLDMQRFHFIQTI